MTFGVIQYVVGHKHLHGVGDKVPNAASLRDHRNFGFVIAGVVAFIAVLALLISWVAGDTLAGSVPASITILILILPVFYCTKLFRNRTFASIERDHVKAFVAVFLGSAAFWMVSEQSGSTLTLFAEKVTDLHIVGWEIPASAMQSVNPLFIIIFAPIFAALWTKLADRAPRTPVKFAIALLGVGLSFLILIIPMSSYQNNGSYAAIWWLMTTYVLQTWAELLLSPTGLSATSKLAPRGSSGQMLTLWLLSVSVGTSVGGQIGRVTAGNPVYTFVVCAAITIVIGTALLAFSKKIATLMHGVH